MPMTMDEIRHLQAKPVPDDWAPPSGAERPRTQESLVALGTAGTVTYWNRPYAQRASDDLVLGQPLHKGDAQPSSIVGGPQEVVIRHAAPLVV